MTNLFNNYNFVALPLPCNFQRLSGGEFVGFNNSVFLAEKEEADRNYALAYYMKENNCFPKGTNIKQCLDFWYQVKTYLQNKERKLIENFFMREE